MIELLVVIVDTGCVNEAHNNGGNFAYLDGHAKWLTLTKAHENNLYYWYYSK